MTFHDYANLFPMLGDAELRTLADDIRARGQQVPITLHEGKILDGRNRHRACELAGVEPRFDEFAGDDALAFVVSHNLHRRHLTESQRGMVAARLATMKQGERTDLPSIDGKSAAVAQREAGKMLKVGESMVQRSKKIQRKGVPEIVAAVEAGTVPVGAAYKVVDLPEEKQRELVAAGAAAVRSAAKALRETPVPKPAKVESPAAPRNSKFVPDDAERLWTLAWGHLEKILPTDKSRERVLRQVVDYAQKRLEQNK